MSETDKQPYYSLPEQPYSDDELLLFAKHNLHFYKQGTFMHAAPYEQQEQYAELISRLPPSHQVLSVGIHAPSIVAASEEDFDGLLKRADYNKATPLGIFFHGTPFRGLRTPHRSFGAASLKHANRSRGTKMQPPPLPSAMSRATVSIRSSAVNSPASAA